MTPPQERKAIAFDINDFFVIADSADAKGEYYNNFVKEACRIAYGLTFPGDIDGKAAPARRTRKVRRIEKSHWKVPLDELFN